MFDLSGLPEDQRKAAEEKLKQMSPEEIQELIKQQCLFCKIAAKEIPAKIVYEDENVMAVLDVNPATKGHVLIFTKQHYSIFQQIPDADVARLFTLSKYISTAAFDSLHAEGTNIMVASGAIAGQGAPHALVHVIPRFEKDGLPNQWWEPKKAKDADLDKAAKAIKESLKGVKITSVAPVAKKAELAQPEQKKKRVPFMNPKIP